jgi:8-oxo-dGTP pyrophosphatase MutT (NUDIX family)
MDTTFCRGALHAPAAERYNKHEAMEMTDQEYIGGKRPDNTVWKMKLHLPPYAVPNNDVTAVAALCFQSDKILAVKNPRGWDIPGGHIESGETPVDALIRELSEEASFKVTSHTAIAYLETDYIPKRKTFMIVYKVDGTQGDFTPFAEISACQFMPIDEFLSAYKGGNKDLMQNLIVVIQSD